MSSRVIFVKELRELFRDKRVTIGAFLMPVLLIVMLMQMFGAVESGVRSNRASQIVVLKEDRDTVFVQAFEKLPESGLIYADSLEEAKKLLANGKARLALDLAPDFNQKVSTGQAPMRAWFDSSQPLSQIALGAVTQVVTQLNKDMAKQRLATNGLPDSLLEPIVLKSEDTAKPRSDGAQTLLSLLPYMIVLWAFYGGFSAVSDMMAGEKERGTLETLLLSPVSRQEIARGKLAALFTVCLLSSLCAVLGVVLSVALGRGGGDLLRLDVQSFIAILALTLPLVAMFSGLLFSVSAWARNMREAQTYLTSISFVVLIPAVFSNLIGFTGIDQSPVIKFIPILNTAVGLRDALLGKSNWALIGVAAALHLVMAGLFALWIRRLMERDEILVRT